jgi:glycosyltransferase involved in cell wall biosynthesis
MPMLSIIIPCYNEEKRLNPEIIINFLQNKLNIFLFFVNDGSTDNTVQILESIRKQFPERVFLLNKKKREGKGAAVREGLLESAKNNKIQFHGFIDADLSVSLKEFFRLYEIMSGSDKKFITGSRIKKLGSTIIRNEWRHFYSRIIATFVGFTTKLDVYDTQCSAKIFHTQIITDIFNERFRTKWLFDVEIFYRIQMRIGPLEKVALEEPLLEWIEIKDSKINGFNFFQILREIFIIYKYYRKKDKN